MVTVNQAMEFRVSWLDAPEVTAPELRATWCHLELWVGGRCVTRNEKPSGTARRGIDVSLYPLALWVAENWWSLGHEVSPSTNPPRSWVISAQGKDGWLRRHNFRAAGDGMPWPDLTLVPDGAVTHVRWTGDSSPRGRIAFVGQGEVFLPAGVALRALAESLVVPVLERLSESGVTGSLLHEEWATISALDDDEVAFCRAAAKLGLDRRGLRQRPGGAGGGTRRRRT